MRERLDEGGYEQARRERLQLEYSRLFSELDKEDEEARTRGWIDIGGYNVPYHLRHLVLAHGIHPDQACAIADLYESSEDFFRVFSEPDTFGVIYVYDYDDSRVEESQMRWDRLEEDAVAREQSGLPPER